jgi:hypothetical protein
MAYTRTNWQSGDVITAERLNNLERGALGAEDAAESAQQAAQSASSSAAAAQAAAQSAAATIQMITQQANRAAAAADRAAQDYNSQNDRVAFDYFYTMTQAELRDKDGRIEALEAKMQALTT